jgi:hypothetical protein
MTRLQPISLLRLIAKELCQEDRGNARDWPSNFHIHEFCYPVFVAFPGVRWAAMTDPPAFDTVFSKACSQCNIHEQHTELLISEWAFTHVFGISSLGGRN